MKRTALKRKLLALAACFAMMTTMFPTAAFATDPAGVPENITNSGLDLSKNLPTETTTYQAGEGTVTYTPAAGDTPASLTLENATLKGPGKDEQSQNIKPRALTVPNTEAEVNVILIGDNEITGFDSAIGSGDSGSDDPEKARVTITGEGTLQVSACNYFAHSLYDLTLDGAKITAKVTMDGILIAGNAVIKNRADVTLSSQNEMADCIGAVGDVVIKNSTVKLTTNRIGIYRYVIDEKKARVGVEISNSTVTIDGNKGQCMFGIRSENYPILLDTANVEIRGVQGHGLCAALDTSNSVYPVSEDRKIVIAGDSKVKIEAESCGIQARENAPIVLQDRSEVCVTGAKIGMQSETAPSVKNKALLEISSTEKAVSTADIDLTEHVPGYAVLAGESDAANLSEWDQNTALTDYPYLKITPKPTVRFVSGNEQIEEQAYLKGTLIPEPPTPVRAGWVFAGWYQEADYKTVWDFAADKVTDDMTLYAKWIPETAKRYLIQGTVTKVDANVVNAEVILLRGTEKIAAAHTSAEGQYRFENVLPGVYNLAVTNGSQTKTVAVNVTTGDVTANISLPNQSISSVVKVELGTPDITVGALDEEAESTSHAPQVGEQIIITLHASEKEESSIQKEAAAIKALAGNQTVQYLDFSVKKETQKGDSVTSEAIKETGNVLEIAVPFQTVARNNFKVYRYHENIAGSTETTAFIKLSDRPTKQEAYQDATYYVGDGYIIIYAKKFSTYAIGYDTVSSGGSGSYVPITKPDDSKTDEPDDQPGEEPGKGEITKEEVQNTKFLARSQVSSLHGYYAVRVKWFRTDGRLKPEDFDGFEIQRSLKRNSGYRTIYSTDGKLWYKNNAHLQLGKKYYYRVRCYKYIDGEKVYTKWSWKAWRTVKTKDVKAKGGLLVLKNK